MVITLRLLALLSTAVLSPIQAMQPPAPWQIPACSLAEKAALELPSRPAQPISPEPGTRSFVALFSEGETSG